MRQMDDKPSEKICAQRFVDWYNTQEGSSYVVERTEDVFSELIGKTRWDFIAWHKESGEWIALEVKKLPFLRLESPLSFWRRLCSEVTTEAKSRFSDTFEVRLPPSLNLRQQERKELVTILAEVIAREANVSRPIGNPKDIGPEIATHFSDWPKTKSNGRKEYKQWGEYRPSRLLILRKSDEGCELKLGSSPQMMGHTKQAVESALDQIFKTQKAVQANGQLGLAKMKGARKTILLLDSDPACDENYIREYLLGLPPQHLSNIDRIYSVRASEVVEVFPQNSILVDNVS